MNKGVKYSRKPFLQMFIYVNIKEMDVHAEMGGMILWIWVR